MPRQTGSSIAAVLVLACVASFAQAQQKPAGPGGYPAKPIRVLITSAAGGGLDMVSRAVAEKLGERLGRAVVADNQAGGNGIIAAGMLAEAAPDGYTLMSTSNSMVLNGVFNRFKFDIRQTYAPVARQSSQYYMAYAPVSLKANSIKELIALSKASPGKINFGSSGVGSVIHLGMEMFQSGAGVKMVHIPYKGNGPANVDLIAGRLDLLLGSISGIQLVKAGKAKILGTTSPVRLADYPDVPTVAESGVPGFELGNTYTLYAPIRTPAAIVAFLNQQVGQLLSLPEVKAKFAADNSEAAPPIPPEQLRADFLKEFQRWEGVVKAAGITADML
jgi:tripartite-type tricarboxylate transporter receptor subunit TctC